MNAKKLSDVELAGILEQGAFFRLEDYALRAELNARIAATFMKAIEQLAGESCRKQVAADGLGQLHRHFPIAKIHLLEAHLMRELRDELYYWSYRVGADTLGLADPFYVDHLVVFRIHYPFLVAREAGDIEHAPASWGERLRLGLAALRDWQTLRDFADRRRTRGAETKSSHDPFAYHGQLPVPARSHGPHLDTWYGHSYDGINLWLSIDGVNADNTVILYPEMFGRPVAFDPVSMYLARGIEVSQPHKIDLHPGELLVFNPEMLHGTQVNISDQTRVALTTRINPAAPRFGAGAPFYMEHWYCSEDLKRRSFSHVRHFAHARHQGTPSIIEREPYQGNKTVRMVRDEAIGPDAPGAVCRADALPAGSKLAVDFRNAKLLLWRDGDELRAFSRRCPHLGVDLADGYHADGKVFCPGHGIAFSLSDGRSKCASFRLQQFRAFEQDDTIYVQQLTAPPDPAATGRLGDDHVLPQAS
jgi:nitrite reductase/ring-hydroxylating ferredoxin subunit